MFISYLDRLGDWNPQLFREVKGRLNFRNLGIAGAIAILGQILLLLTFSGQLPTDLDALNDPPFQYSRYCTATAPPGSYAPYKQLYCIQDLFGNWVINWQLWWLDIFNTLSVVGLVILLTTGIFLLIADLSREENRGTFNFIRLSPRSANNILLGKILGVPCVIYFLCLLLFPLHLIAGFQAHISPSLLLAYYGVIIASCGFFYSLALLFGSVSSGLGGFQSFLGSGVILFFLFIMTSITFSSSELVSHTPLDWIILFYPGNLLSYLVESTYLPPDTANLQYESFYNLAWYGQQLWENPILGIGFILGNYSLWTYWINQSLDRRFRNPNATWFSKLNSYYLSASFIIIVTGFVFQSGRNGNFERHIFENFAVLQIFIVFFACFLMVALSPNRQTLHDWARYRHQNQPNRRSLLQELILGEKSPSTLAIAFNLGIMFLYLIPGIIMAPINNSLGVFVGLFLSMNVILIYAVIGQRILLLKIPKQTLVAGAVVGILMFFPPICFSILGGLPHQSFTPWLFTFFSIAFLNNHLKSLQIMSVLFSLLSQWGIIALAGFEMSKRFKKVGESETKALLK
ncbi:hypothetical protein VB715_08385 [Crocosphaera sp. UHCC 0190]|uniref:hypothetical protein n=1 Tax=Crocosphaera sp. UHCC 0190 TaxID=3110246 RepID=UPI002B20EBA0|nr:hypothetical protein [Crocosphaera sp. UHCC 0190]MEA5509780.1 hypothetical protein [Crocosphaera sp. UHCC 0190]